MIIDRTFWKNALVRAIKTICQTLGSMLPVGYVVTPAIIEALDWSVLYIVIAWLATGLLAGLASILTSIATGLPEVELEQALDEAKDEDEYIEEDEEEGDMDE